MFANDMESKLKDADVSQKFVKWQIVSEPDKKKLKNNVPQIPVSYLRGIRDDGSSLSGVFEKARANPLVPIGMLATVVCLIGMCRATLHRNTMMAQYFMRGRIGAQAFTVAALVGGVVMFASAVKPANHEITKD